MTPADGTIAAVITRVWESRTLALYLSPFFWASIALILALEWWRPARPEQRLLSRGLRVDVLYVAITHVSGFLITVLYLAALERAYRRFAGAGVTAPALPFGVRVVIGILLGDFVAWAHHWVRHRVPLFWRFHAVHHAQRELNAFTDLRYHPLEYVVTATFRAVPLFALGAAFPVAAGWSLLADWYTKLVHANVRTRLGPLRWVLVTPQSHRVHHSRAADHRDSNYGVVFSVWDRMFGTQHLCDDAYPDTGIDDPAFPDEWSPRAPPLTAPLAHLVYPFRASRVTAARASVGS